MSKPLILAVAGLLAGVAVAFAAFTMFLGGESAPAEAATPEPVHIAGKLGPHITLSDRVFNLLTPAGASPLYLKLQTVIEFNGPGHNGSEIRNGATHQIRAGDVVVIPAGTGHWFTRIDDHINYLMVRVDPDKVTPLRSEAQSKAYLSK